MRRRSSFLLFSGKSPLTQTLFHTRPSTSLHWLVRELTSQGRVLCPQRPLKVGHPILSQNLRVMIMLWNNKSPHIIILSSGTLRLFRCVIKSWPLSVCRWKLYHDTLSNLGDH